MDKLLRNNWFVLGAILAAAFLLYGNGIGGDFVFDDTSVIVGNPLVENISGVFTAFANPYHYARPQSGLYRPLTFASFTLNWHLSQSPAGFHIINIILHALVCFFIFLVIAELSDRRIAAIGSAVFLFLPIHVESVTSIVGRGELLALLFSVGALYAYLKERPMFAVISFGAALLSKEVSVALIPIIVLLEFVWKKKNIRATIESTIFYAIPLAIYAGLRYAVLGARYVIGTNAYSFFNPLKTAGFFAGIWTACKVLALYVQKIIFPTYFSSDYSYNQIAIVHNLFSSWQAMVGVAILLCLVSIAVVRRNHLIGLGCVVFLSSYFIVSNLVVKTGTIMAERLMYMPSFGCALIVSGLALDLRTGRRWVQKLTAGIFFIALFVYGIQVVHGNALWKNEKTLFENAYRHAPQSVVNMSNLATMLFREGKAEEALAMTDKALALEPRNAPTLHLAGQIQMSMKHEKEAIALWHKAVDIAPDYLYPYLSLGTLYYTKKNFLAGERMLIEARKQYTTPNVIMLLAINQTGLRKYPEAIATIENQFGKYPEAFELRFALGFAYLKSGQEQKAWELLMPLKDPRSTDEMFKAQLRKMGVLQIEMP